MSKRITSFLVVAVALLLAMPAQAQTLKKKKAPTKLETPKQMKLTTPKAQKDAQLKAADTAEGLSFRQADGTSTDVPTQQKKLTRESRIETPSGTAIAALNSSRTFKPAPVRRNAAHRAAEVVDEHGIITSPAEGEELTYTRAGGGYYLSGGKVYLGDQSGTVTLVECSDGTVYIQGIISFSGLNTWVKGTKSGNTLTVPLGQPVSYSSDYDATIGLYWGEIDAEGNISKSASTDAVTFTIAGDVITLQGTSGYEEGVASTFIGLFWDDDNSFSGYGDYETVWTKLNVVTQVDELPYANNFDDAGLQASFTIVDANEDGSTWSFVDGAARYKYNGSNAGDDWLLSPAIKLEAGKKYQVTLDTWAQSSNYPERIEVKMGADKTAAAMTNQVVASTDVTWTSNDTQTLESSAIEVAEDGYYYFGIHAISDADEYYLYADNFTIAGLEGAVPAAVSDFAVVQTENQLEATVSFKAPTKNLSDEDLTDNISVDIYRDGAVIKTLEDVVPGSEQSYVDNDGLTLGTHKYLAIAKNAAGEGGKSEEVSIFVSAIITVPYTFDMSQEGVLDIFTVIDANEDGKTWLWSSSNNVYYPYNSNAAADDYLVSMPIALQAGKNYNVILNAQGKSGYPERFEVKLGKTATVEGLSQTLIEPTEITNVEGEDYENIFTVEEDGNYYLAVHGISDADQYYLILNKLTIENGAEPTSPAAPVLEPIAGGLGDMSATIKITAPTKAFDGSDLTDNLTKVEVYRDGELVGQIENVAPGATKRFLDEDFTATGIYTYQAIPYNASGKGVKSEKAKIFVGLDEPDPVDNFVATDNQTTVTLTWDKVDGEGVNGGYVNPAEVTYNVWSTKIEETIFGSQLVLDEILGGDVDIDNYVVDYNTEEGEQGYEYWVVETQNEATNPADGGYMVTTPLLVGEAYALPVEEGFEGSQLHYFWESEAGLGVSEDATDGDGVALQLYTEEAGVFSFDSGKLNLKSAANPTLIFDVKGVGITSMDVTGSVDGADLAKIQTVAVGSDYATVKVPLSALKEGRYARIGFSANFVNPTVIDIDWNTYEYVYDWGDLLIIDNIKIVDLYEYDLTAQVKAPAKVVAGNSAAITATVSNRGENAAQGYTVKVFAGEKEIFNETVNDALAPFTKKEFTAEFATTVFDEAADVTIKAVVEYENELNPDDNEAETLITINEPTVPAPATLTATDNGVDGVDLAWTIAADEARAAAEVTEGFDDEATFPEFETGGITADEHNGAFGDWTLYDGNGIGTYGFNGVTFPNAYQPMAFIPFNPTSDQLSADMSANYAPHSDAQFMISFCPVDENNNAPAADHWMISPALSGDAQTISFYAREITTNYGPETLEILASSTDNQPESFTVVSEESVDVTEWTEYTAALPAGTKYFAIRHTATDVFGLMIDDVTFVSGGAAPMIPVNFNVYYEQEKLATVAADVTTYTAKADQIGVGSHTFAVTAVYASGAESKPVTATVDVVNSINQIAVNGQPVDVYTLDGKLVRRQVTSLAGLKGLYIINGKKVMVK